MIIRMWDTVKKEDFSISGRNQEPRLTAVIHTRFCLTRLCPDARISQWILKLRASAPARYSVGRGIFIFTAKTMAGMRYARSLCRTMENIQLTPIFQTTP